MARAAVRSGSGQLHAARVVLAPGMGDQLPQVPQRTSRPGIYAAGDVTSFRRQQVIHAASSGVAAAKAVVEDLTAAQSRTAVKP